MTATCQLGLHFCIWILWERYLMNRLPQTPTQKYLATSLLLSCCIQEFQQLKSKLFCITQQIQVYYNLKKTSLIHKKPNRQPNKKLLPQNNYPHEAQHYRSKKKTQLLGECGTKRLNYDCKPINKSRTPKRVFFFLYKEGKI